MNYENDVTVIINNYLDYESFLNNLTNQNLLNYYLPISSSNYKEKERIWGSSSNMRYVEIINEDDIIDDYTLSTLTEEDYCEDINLKINFRFETSGNPPYLWYEYIKKQNFIKEIYYNIKQNEYCGITEKSLEFFHSTSENNREIIERKYDIMLKIKFENDNNNLEDIVKKINIIKEKNISDNIIILEDKLYYKHRNRFIDIERKEKKIIMHFKTNEEYDSLFWTFDEITKIEEFILNEMKKINNKCSTKIIFENKII